MRLNLGPFVWAERPAGVFGWRMPAGATQAIDFRGLQGNETPGAYSPAQAIFVCPDDVILPPPWVQIASDPAETLTTANRLRLRTAFQHSKVVSARRFADVLHELMTTHTELDRTRCAPPRIASRDGKIKWLIGGQVVHAVTPEPGSPEWAGVVARHQQAYRGMRGQGRLHSKYLATLIGKYRLSEAQGVGAFIPADLPREEPVTPETTYTESFPGTSATLGGDQTWTEFSGTWENVSGVGSHTSDINTRCAICDSALSTDDMRVEVSILTSSASYAYRGPIGRMPSGAFTGYSCLSRPEINDYYGQRIVSGVFTDIITSELSGSVSTPTTDAVVIDGDQIEIFQGANSRGSTTDTNIAGNVRGGIGVYAENLTVTFDSWRAEDLTSGVSGSSATTNANDTSSASGTTTVTGTLARTNAGDTASASGSVGSPITGTVAATNAGDTSSAAGTTTVTGASARTAGNDSASAAGTTTVLGTAARTNADDTGSASGSVGGAVSGTAAVTAADDTAAASGTTAVTGAVSATAGNDTATASGAAGAVSGSAAATGGDDTASAAGATAGGQQAGGWGQSRNRKPRDYTPSAEQIHAERVRLGILPAEEAPAAVAESAPVSSSAPAAAKPLAVPSLSRVEIDAAAIVAANEAIRAAIAAAQQEELPRLVWESVQQDEAAVVALIAELV